MATLFRNFDDGIIDLQMLVNGLKYKKFHHNICFIRKMLLITCTAYLMEDSGCDLPTALKEFYNSETFAKLSDESTGLYIESSAYVYEMLKGELTNGRLK